MTTSGVQLTGMRAGAAGGITGIAGSVKTAGRAGANGSSFADMVSSNLSAQKDTATAQPKVERPQGTQNTDAQPKAEPVADAKVPEKDVAADVDANGQTEKAEPEQGAVEEGMPDADAQTPEENGALDTQFPKSLKLFKEAANLLEAQKLNELKQAVMDSLNIDEEELKKILEQLGVNMQELLQPQILQQVVVEVQGAGDPAVLLTNETAMNTLKDLLAKVEEFTAATQQTETFVEDTEVVEDAKEAEVPEEIPEFEELLTGMEKQVTQNVAEPTEKPVENQKPVDTESVQTQEKPGFSFEVVKESVPTEQTRQNPTDSRGSDAKADTHSMAEQFLNLVTNAAPKDEVEFSQLSRSEQVREVAQQILERVRVFVGEAQTSMEISLTPESLGRVTLNLVSRQGALTAHFTAQNQIAKEAIESQIVVLRENLESQGLKVEAIEVTVSNFDFTKDGGASANNGGQGNRQRRRGVTFDEAVNAENALTGMRDAEEIAADMMERSGNQVNYTA